MQDRILGPLTMVQFLYAIIGGGLCYSIFMTVPRPLSYVFVVPLALFTFALSFLKVNERPFLDFFLAAINYYSTPKKRIWHHHAADNLSVTIFEAKAKKSEVQTKHISHEKIEELAGKLDQT